MRREWRGGDKGAAQEKGENRLHGAESGCVSHAEMDGSACCDLFELDEAGRGGKEKDIKNEHFSIFVP